MSIRECFLLSLLAHLVLLWFLTTPARPRLYSPADFQKWEVLVKTEKGLFSYTLV